MQAHTFPRSLEPACTQPTVTSALPRQLTVPGDLPFIDDTMQRVADRVDSSNVYTHSIEQLLADLPPPPHVRRQPILPLSSARIQTTASEYVNTDFTTSLHAQRYADTPLYVNTTLAGNAPPTLPIQLGQGNVTDVPNLYAQSYTFDAQHSSGLVALNPNIARSSYADNSQRLPIVVVAHWVARWLSGRASDLRSSSRGFEARPRRCCVTTLGKLFTPYCLCHQAV